MRGCGNNRNCSRGSRPRGRVKREAGENPARSRHCEQRASRFSIATVPFRNGKVAGFALTCESGDLPWRRPEWEARHLAHAYARPRRRP